MSLKWKTAVRKVKDLIPYEYNPRKMSAEQMEKLRESLDEFGMVEIPRLPANRTKIDNDYLNMLESKLEGDKDKLLELSLF